MSASTKLSTAVKALCYLASVAPEAKTSSEIADQIGVNASKLRKILSYLVKSKIVVSTQGITGGFTLNKSPEQIHLQEIYCSVEERKAFHMDFTGINGKTVSQTKKLNNFFLQLFADIQVDIEDRMKLITLKSVIEQIKS